MRLILLSLFTFLLILPSTANAAQADLLIGAEDIRFSKSVLIAGDTVRLYARVHNIGQADVQGYVTFFQGSSVISTPQIISVLVDGAPEEVYIDFVVPSGTFNIRAEVRQTDPEDVNMSNNTAITQMLVPVNDADRDGVADQSDNCRDVANTDQLNTDKDGVGDVCDDDDDNDGVTDSVEAELGSNSKVGDTDGDGASDANDAFPNDPKKQKISVEPPKPVQKPPEPTVKTTTPPIPSVTPEETAQKASPTIVSQNTGVSDKTVVKETQTEERNPDSSSTPIRKTFAATQTSWNTYTFHPLGPVDSSVHYDWNFGDGVRSNKPEVSHTYKKSGSYLVMLTTQDSQGQTAKETTTVLVPFFSLHNHFIQVLMGALILLLAGGVWMYLTMGKQKTSPVHKIEVREE
ncbi:MAG: PKD domain-containing protein [Patescibacteria group bacterium]